MRRVLTLAVVCLLLGGTAVAGGLQRSLEAPQRVHQAGKSLGE